MSASSTPTTSTTAVATEPKMKKLSELDQKVADAEKRMFEKFKEDMKYDISCTRFNVGVDQLKSLADSMYDNMLVNRQWYGRNCQGDHFMNTNRMLDFSIMVVGLCNRAIETRNPFLFNQIYQHMPSFEAIQLSEITKDVAVREAKKKRIANGSAPPSSS